MGSNAPLDRLTGLPTRGALDELDRDFRKRPDGEVWSALVIDVDNFKMINDVFGHLAGDRILQQVAYLLVRNVRQSDEAVRFGGDEFVVVLRGTGKLQAVNMAQRFLEDVQRETFQGGVRVGVSLGLAESVPEDRSLSAVLDKADHALYDSKARGKGKVAFFRERIEHNVELSFDHFVDRQTELRILRSALDQSLEKGCSAVLVTGEPGVGKTRLVSELRHYCAFKGCAFSEVKYDEVGGAGPFGLLVEPLRILADSMTDAERGSLASSCGPVLPETAGLFPSLGLKLLEGPPPPDWARGRVFYGDVSSILRETTARKPVALLVDDLQWAYLQDLDLLGYLARSAGSMKLLLVFTMRAPVEDYREAWSWLGVLRRFIPLSRIDLHPLEEEHAANMVMLALRDPQVPQSILETITRQSGGNPYYIRELLRALKAEGALSGGSGLEQDYQLGTDRLPDGITHLVRSRLDLLDRTSREVLRMGALLVGSFSLDALSFLLELPPLHTARALEEPLRMELVHEETGENGEPLYRFNHDCVRGCLLEEVSAGVRKSLYTRLGRFYEERWSRGESHLLSQAAYCYCEGLDTEKAAEFARLAAEDAASRQASFDQALWLENYVRFAGASADEDRSGLFDAWLELGGLHVLHGRHEDAESVFEQAAGLASGSLQRGELAFARASLLYNRAEYDKAIESFREACDSGISGDRKILCRMRIAFINHFRGASDEAMAILDEIAAAIALLPEGPEKRRLEATYDNTRGFINVQFAHPDEGIELCRRAVRTYGEIGDTKQQARAMLNLASTLASHGAWEERLKLLGEAVAILTESGDVHSLMVAFINLGQVYQAVNQDDLAEEYFKRCLDLVEATGTPRFRVWAECHLGTIEEKRGNLEDSQKHLARAVATAVELGYGRMAVISNLNMAITISRMKRFGEAWEILDRIEKESGIEHMGAGIKSAFLQVRAVVRFLDETGDRRRKLVEVLEFIGQSKLAGGADVLEALETAWVEARALRELGRTDEMKAVLDQALSSIEKCLSGMQSPLIREDLKRADYISGLMEMQREILQGPADDGTSGP